MSEHPGTVETNRSMAIVYEAWSVATQAPGGISRWAAAISLVGTLVCSRDSRITWNTVKTTRVAAAVVMAERRSHPSRVRVLPAGRAESSRAAGSAIVRARNGAGKAGEGEEE